MRAVWLTALAFMLGAGAFFQYEAIPMAFACLACFLVCAFTLVALEEERHQ